MTGAKLISDLAELRRKAIKDFDKSKSVPDRWILSGYIDILDDAIGRTRRHSHRALRAYSGVPVVHARCGNVGVEVAAK